MIYTSKFSKALVAIAQKNHENLDPTKGEPGRLREALRLNESLAVAYYLKDDLKQLWEQPDKQSARMKIYDWYHKH